MAVWNSEQAKQFRRGILDGTFSQCDPIKCPAIADKRLPSSDQVSDPLLREIIANKRIELETGPKHVKLAHDASCNLYCTSCRSERMAAGKQQQKRLDEALEKFIVPFLRTADVLELSGDGDPFASKHYRDVMVRTYHDNPKLGIALQTNGVLCDERAWSDCYLEGRVRSVLVSVDAATDETYRKVRRGGDFTRLRENLAFLAGLRRVRRILALNLLFVVQTVNFSEMAEFVRMAKHFNADTVSFSLIRRWERAMSMDEFRDAQVWRPEHPMFGQFTAALKDAMLDDPIVRLGDLSPLRESVA